MIAVVTYGVGNVGSIFSMLRKIGVSSIAASTPDEIEAAERIILPGVGSFDHGMKMLAQRGLIDPLRRRAVKGTPILGICLGMQLLGMGSEEGSLPGLGIINAHCVKFSAERPGALKVPHMGWNDVRVTRPHPLFAGMEEEPSFYFLHSYYLTCRRTEDVLAEAVYGGPFTCAVSVGNIFGAQFHPEKSHRNGIQLLKNFASL